MEISRHALLLVGSPKSTGSASESLGTYLIAKLESGGFVTQTVHIQTLVRSPQSQEALVELVKASDILVLAFPLYIDSLPAAVISALELIAQRRQSQIPLKEQALLAIVNNGFPEAGQNSTAIAICRQFCHETGIQWVGGLSLGGGGIISGRPLVKAGFMLRNTRKALDMAASDLIANKPVRQEAANLMAKPIVPKWLYASIGNRSWKKAAKAFGSQDKLYG